MLKNGVSVNCMVGNDRLLIVVCRYGYLNIVLELLKVKVFVNFDIGFGIFLIVVCE